MAETKQCPYCGEEILAIAKKCKHCGEWLDGSKPQASVLHNAFQEKMKAQNDDAPNSSSCQTKSSQSNGSLLSKKNSGCAKGCLIAVAAVIIIIVICFFVSTRKPSTNNTGVNYNDSTVVEEVPVEVESYYDEDGPGHSAQGIIDDPLYGEEPRDHSAQGSYNDDNEIHSLDEYYGN